MTHQALDQKMTQQFKEAPHFKRQVEVLKVRHVGLELMPVLIDIVLYRIFSSNSCHLEVL
jgi:hypothetical protein